MPPAVIGAEELGRSRGEEVTGSRENGNLTPLRLFDFIQIATQLDIALNFLLYAVLVKNLVSHEGRS